MRWWAALLVPVAAILAMAGAGQAQHAPRVGVPASAILTIESDRLFAESQFGQRVAQEVEADQSVHLAENRRIEAVLTAEEQTLTEKRKDMTPEDFRAVADAFDARVEEYRQLQDAKALEIAQRREREEALFVQAARPVLAQLMQEAGASVILEKRTILLSSNAIDVTDLAIARLNAAIGDGAGLVREPQQ